MNQQGFDALSDDLSLVNDIFEKKIDEYTERYPNIRHPSRRAMREKFVKCPVLHSAYINQAARLAKLQSTSASRAGGITVINHIRDALIDSGEVYRSEMKPSRRAPQIGLLVDRDELHPESILLPRWRHQKTYLRVVAAELEAMGLILYLDHNLIEEKLILENQRIDKYNAAWNFSRLSEENIDIVRHLYLG